MLDVGTGEHSRVGIREFLPVLPVLPTASVLGAVTARQPVETQTRYKVLIMELLRSW